MRRTIGNAATPEVEDLVLTLLREDAEYDNNENRSAHREHLVLSVKVHIRRPEEVELPAFSRNVSASGIGLITHDPIADRAIAAIEIERLQGGTSTVLSECRWCRPYGSNWFISGWHFITIQK